MLYFGFASFSTGAFDKVDEKFKQCFLTLTLN